MGINERDYGRSERTPWDRVQNTRSITVTLIVINVVIFFVDMIFVDPQTKNSILADWFHVNAQTIVRPWMWWQFLTYGFMHDASGITHILFNMFGLFVFGRIVEQRIGRMEFLRFYLVAIVVGGIVGSASSFAYAMASGIPLSMYPGTIGASGAVIAVAIVFACYYPNQTLLLMFVLPVKAWVVAVMFVVMDLYGVLGQVTGMGTASNTAFTVHLAGAFFALLYYFRHWSLQRLDLEAIADLPDRFRQRSRRMKLKLHDPDKKIQNEAAEADRILAKIHQSGESSLTSSERKTLERYSRRQREKRNQ
jgi:membrane associated rhomboid family serine protease